MKNKYTKTELPITIITDDEHKTGDNLELTRQRIEKATLYIHSLFNSIRYSLENLPSFDDQKLEEVVWDARNVCELGYGVADSILASASCLTEFQPDEKAESDVETKQPTDAISPDYFTNLYKRTGERIERVLASDNVSKEVKNILEALVNEAANEAGFSFPETDEIALKLPKIFAALGKQKSPFMTYFSAIETVLNHGGCNE
jgi:hypothetical protein